MSTPRQTEMTPPPDIIEAAIRTSLLSPCRSKRGVAIFDSMGLVVTGFNYKPPGFECDGSLACKATCRHEAIHAEQDALLNVERHLHLHVDVLHVKTVDGQLVPSGGPSCVQCSKLILAAGIAGVWLYHESGWRRYEAREFHRLSLVADAPQVTTCPDCGKTLHLICPDRLAKERQPAPVAAIPLPLALLPEDAPVSAQTYNHVVEVANACYRVMRDAERERDAAQVYAQDLSRRIRAVFQMKG